MGFNDGCFYFISHLGVECFSELSMVRGSLSFYESVLRV